MTGEVSLASRETGHALTRLFAREARANNPDDPPVRNGQVIGVLLDGHFDMAEMAGMSAVPMDDVRQPVEYVDPNGAPPSSGTGRTNPG